MKKLILFFMSTMMILCGCSLKALPKDECDFLVEANWEGNDTQCVNVITFKEDGGFSNWCYCGSTVGDSDLVEGFRYRASDKTVHLLDDKNEVMETGTIQYVDERYLIIDVWNRCYVYENLDVDRPTPRASTLEYVGTEEMTKPCLYILGYEDGMLQVSAHNYDGDAAADFEVWTLPAHEDVVFSDVSVWVENGTETIETSQLTKEDLEYIGEFYTVGYVELNYDGEVVSVVFYGENISDYGENTGDYGNTLSYEGKSYVYLDYPMNIFNYNYYGNGYFEEDVIYPIDHERWDMIYMSGDLFILDEQIEDAIAYYADDDNYDWFVVFDEEDGMRKCPLSITPDELEYLYVMDERDVALTETLTFDDIKQFADIQKISKDQTVFALISLAHCKDSWYWKSEVMVDAPDSNEEYMVILPDSLSEKIFAVQ